ncbi:MAG: NADH-quinone oxidoreductase subunit N [bacterium]
MTFNYLEIWRALRPLSPELIVLVTAVLVLLLDAFWVKGKKALGNISLFGIVLAGLAAATLWDDQLSLFKGFFILDHLALFFKLTFLLIAALAVLLSMTEGTQNLISKTQGIKYCVPLILILFIACGMLLTASAGELVTLFLSIELMSIPMYVLAASKKKESRSSEAGLKYFILGALSSVFFLYGLSLIYGLSGSTRLSMILLSPSFSADFSPVWLLGIAFLLAGVGFKIIAAPFHMWAPDVYEGAPTPITAFIAAGPKAAGLVILLRLFFTALSPFKAEWVFLFAVLSLLSMLVGNLAALPQTSIKRMLAYSGVAHMGYLLTALAAGSAEGLGAALFYIVIYALTAMGAFAVVFLVEEATGSDRIENFAGLGRRSPALAFVLAITLLSAAGLPPLSGFIGKFYLFASACGEKLYLLALIGILTSVISLYYYLGVLRQAYLVEPKNQEPIRIPAPCAVVIIVSALAAAALGLLPAFTSWTFSVAKSFLAGLGM